jgi:hypothetical protein
VLADKDSIVTIPFRAFLSNGTAPDTGLSNDSMRASANGAAQFTCTNKISAVSAGAGQYAHVLTASETSILGSLAVWYDQGDFPQHVATIEVVNSNPYSSLSAIAAKDYSSTVTFGVGAIKAATYSGVTVGVGTIAAATYSGVTVGVNNIAAGTYSGATVGINNIAAGSYSGVTIAGVTSGVTLLNGSYSGVTISGVNSGVTLLGGTYSNVTVQVNNGTGVALSATGLDSVSSVGLGVQSIVSQVWDRVLTAATHNIASSAGRRLRSYAGSLLLTGTASAGGPDSITLTGGSATDALYVGCGITIVGGTGAGQSRYIVGYVGGTTVASVARHWTTAPDNTSVFEVVADNQIAFIAMGSAQTAAAGTITLAAASSAVTDIYKGQGIRILAGTGDDQERLITGYAGATKVATIDRAWTTIPAVGDFYGTLSGSMANVGAITPATYSGVTVSTAGGSFTLADGDYSAVTVRVGGIKPDTYSGVTVETTGGTFSLADGDYSGVTVRVGGMKAQVYSGVTIAGVTSGVTLLGGQYSDVSSGGVTRVNSNVSLAAGTWSGVTVGVNNVAAGSYSGVTIAGVTSGVTLLPGQYSGATVGIDNIKPASYSGVTVAGVTSGVTLLAGTYSDVTIGGVTRVNSNVSLASGTWSGVTVGTNNIAAGSYSGVTIAGVTSGVTVLAGGIAAASFAAGAIDAAAVATDTEDAIADALLARNVAGGSSTGRTVKQALYSLRNKVAIDGSVATVYGVDDATASWVMSIATVSVNSGIINVVDPG